MHLCTVFLVIICSVAPCTCPNAIPSTSKESSELVAVAVYFRHGDRSPMVSFPNDEYYNSEYWPMGYGQLTKFGIMRHYKLGQWFRQHYKNFLNELYLPNETYIVSTDCDRTLMSAYANLAGLYPPKNFQIWNNQILWQPIPVHTVERLKDNIITDKRKCKKFDAIFEKAKSTKYKLLEKQYAELVEYIRIHTGWPNVSIDDVKTLRSNLYVYSHYNKSFIPEWTKGINQNQLDYLAAVVYELPTTTTTLARLSIGPFFEYFFDYFDSFVKPSGKTKQKFLMISGHDTSMVSILDAMGAFVMRPVNFADTLLWELKKKTDGIYFINLFYKRDNELELLNIHNCEFDCKYNDFKHIMSSITISIDDWLMECGT